MSESKYRGYENLKPPRTTDEARTRGRNGGIRSGQARREKRRIADILDRILSEKITDAFLLEDIQNRGLPVGKNPTYKDYIVASVIVSTAEKGRLDDLLKLMQLLGEKPMEADSDALQAAKLLLMDIQTVIE